jgi:hypothetical protein
MDVLLAILLLVGLPALLPRLLRASRRSARKGAVGGIVMGLGLAFMIIFDPARAASVEEVQRRKDLGEPGKGESGEPN